MKFVFVCMGNTCRSPMAEALMNAQIKKRGMTDSYALSCGVMACEGAPANGHACEAVLKYGVTLDGHSAERIKRHILEGALVMCMDTMLLRYVKSAFPDADAHDLCEYASVEGTISDPYGLGMGAYEECAMKLNECIGHILDRMG